MRKFTKLPSQEELREHFEYIDGHLYWTHNTSRRSEGDELGVVDKKTGYRVGCLNYTRFCVHRVVWVYFNGDIPDGKIIDHINRDKLDNRIENLRLVNEKMSIHNRHLKHKTPVYRRGKRWCFLNVETNKREYFDTRAECMFRRYEFEIEYWGEPRPNTVKELLSLQVSP